MPLEGERLPGVLGMELPFSFGVRGTFTAHMFAVCVTGGIAVVLRSETGTVERTCLPSGLRGELCSSFEARGAC